MYYKLLTGGLLLFLGVGMGQRALAQTGSRRAEPIRLTPTEDSLFLRRLADEVLVNGKAYSNLRGLPKTIGGRLSPSPPYYQSEAWGQKALQDAGADKVWLQECMVPHWVRGGKDSASWSGVGSGSGTDGGSGTEAGNGSVAATGDEGRRGGGDIHAPGDCMGE